MSRSFSSRWLTISTAVVMMLALSSTPVSAQELAEFPDSQMNVQYSKHNDKHGNKHGDNPGRGSEKSEENRKKPKKSKGGDESFDHSDDQADESDIDEISQQSDEAPEPDQPPEEVEVPAVIEPPVPEVIEPPQMQPITFIGQTVDERRVVITLLNPNEVEVPCSTALAGQESSFSIPPFTQSEYEIVFPANLGPGTHDGVVTCFGMIQGFVADIPEPVVEEPVEIEIPEPIQPPSDEPVVDVEPTEPAEMDEVGSEPEPPTVEVEEEPSAAPNASGPAVAGRSDYSQRSQEKYNQRQMLWVWLLLGLAAVLGVLAIRIYRRDTKRIEAYYQQYPEMRPPGNN